MTVALVHGFFFFLGGEASKVLHLWIYSIYLITFCSLISFLSLCSPQLCKIWKQANLLGPSNFVVTSQENGQVWRRVWLAH